MRATIIGGRGFIGKTLISHLRSLDWEVWSPDRSHFWPDLKKDLGHIFYCAGLTADYYRDPEATLEAHASLLARVLKSSSFSTLVYLSSTRLYDGLSPQTIGVESALLPVGPHIPRHFYDLTKLTGESLCHALGGGKVRIARLSCVYDMINDATGFLPDLLRLLSDGKTKSSIEIESSPSLSRDYIHIQDVVRALALIASGAKQCIYNVASGANTSNADLATIIQKHTRIDVRFSLSNDVAPSPVVSVERMAQEFQWTARPLPLVVGPWLDALNVIK